MAAPRSDEEVVARPSSDTTASWRKVIIGTSTAGVQPKPFRMTSKDIAIFVAGCATQDAW